MKTQPLLPFWTDEMKKLFIKRNQYHRSLVRKNLLCMEGYLGLSREVLLKVAVNHDKSKFKEPERSAYIWMTWMYHCRNNGISFSYPEGISAVVEYGWKMHIVSNSHHPEAHHSCDMMNDLDIVEMVCDWAAIHQESNQALESCMVWAEQNLDIKWDFSLSKKQFIYATIKELDHRITICREQTMRACI